MGFVEGRGRLKSHQSYQDYIQNLRQIQAVRNLEDFAKLIVVHGESDFLRMRTLGVIVEHGKKLMSSNGDEEAQAISVEAPGIDQARFHGLWSQASLFEPSCMYVLKRVSKGVKLATLLKDIPSSRSILSWIVIDYEGDIPTDTRKQLLRLEARLIDCEEPKDRKDFVQIALSMAKRQGVVLDVSAASIILDSVGLDLSKLSNEVQKIGLVFSDAGRVIVASDVVPLLGMIREDHVFELFGLLRSKQLAKADLFVEQLLDRGEKAIAIIGILARHARDLVSRSDLRGAKLLKFCAEADIMLKSSKVPDRVVLSQAIDSLS